jgi:hypothetical protein
MKPPLQVVWVFLDGVGLGPAHARNPLSCFRGPALTALAGGQAWSLGAKPRPALFAYRRHARYYRPTPKRYWPSNAANRL